MLVDRDVVQPIEGAYRLVGNVGELAVPATLQSLLAARLDSLDPDARALVADAAVLGGSFPAEALTAVSGRPEAEVRRLLDELVHREVLGVRADPLSPQRGHYGFVQSMFRQVAYDTSSRRERKSRHLAVATHLQSTFSEGGEEVAEVIAAHLLDALSAVRTDPDVPDLRSRSVEWLVRAGERAQRTGAPASAAITYARAASLLDVSDTSESELPAASLRERAGVMATNAGDLNAALKHFQEAADVYVRRGDTRAAARMDTQVGGTLRRQGRHEDARAKLGAALEFLRADPDVNTVRALAELATLHAFAGEAADADRLSAAALTEAQALDLPQEVVTDLFIIRGIAHGLASRPAQAAANLREAARLAEAAHDSANASRALLNLGDVIVTFDAPAAVAATQAAMVHARRIGFFTMSMTTANLIQALLMTGEWDLARQAYVKGVHEDGLGEDPFVAGSTLLLFAFSGDLESLAAPLAVVRGAPSSEDPQDIAAHESALAAASVAIKDHSATLQHARQALAKRPDSICGTTP